MDVLCSVVFLRTNRWITELWGCQNFTRFVCTELMLFVIESEHNNTNTVLCQDLEVSACPFISVLPFHPTMWCHLDGASVVFSLSLVRFPGTYGACCRSIGSFSETLGLKKQLPANCVSFRYICPIGIPIVCNYLERSSCGDFFLETPAWIGKRPCVKVLKVLLMSHG